MKKFSLLYILLILLALPSCDKENPFDNGKTEEETGSLSKSALAIDLRDEEMLSTRATDYDIDNFVISITKTGQSSPSFSSRFGDMPDVVTLERGTYTVHAEYGSDVDAEWNAPYYTGDSEEFTIEAGKITDNIGDIVCRLQNVKVSIVFDPMLMSNMTDDSFVEVRVTQSGADEGKYLRFTKSDQQRGNSGYFKYLEGVSLVAVFRGVVENLQTVETKSYATVNRGHHYKITFKLHSQAGESVGDAQSSLNVDASVTVTDVERNVAVEEDEILDDSERPEESDPVDPDDPTPPAAVGPKVVAEAPIDLDKSNDVKADSHVVINVSSETGITEFKVNIISDDLAGMVPEVFDLCDPGESLDQLHQLKLLPEDKTTVRGEKNVKFDVSDFMVMLCALGPDKDHTFRLTVSDASGQTVKELKLHTIE